LDSTAYADAGIVDENIDTAIGRKSSVDLII
jgi:hypothetical protein